MSYYIVTCGRMSHGRDRTPLNEKRKKVDCSVSLTFFFFMNNTAKKRKKTISGVSKHDNQAISSYSSTARLCSALSQHTFKICQETDHHCVPARVRRRLGSGSTPQRDLEKNVMVKGNRSDQLHCDKDSPP